MMEVRIPNGGPRVKGVEMVFVTSLRVALHGL